MGTLNAIGYHKIKEKFKKKTFSSFEEREQEKKERGRERRQSFSLDRFAFGPLPRVDRKERERNRSNWLQGIALHCSWPRTCACPTTLLWLFPKQSIRNPRFCLGNQDGRYNSTYTEAYCDNRKVWSDLERQANLVK